MSGSLTIRGRTFHWGERTYLMGILNLTPDSFSGDGLGDDVDRAVSQAVAIAAAGADMLDLGAESTRPGSAAVDAATERSRLLPALEAVRAAVDLPLSVDTYKAAVAAEALDVGADMINDVWGLQRDPEMAGVAARARAPVIAMHNHEGTSYPGGLMETVTGFLRRSVELAAAAGLPQERVICDPGIGFGKTWIQTLEVLRRFGELKALGQPLLVGTSRKSTIGRILDLPADQRVEGTGATVALAIAQGVDIVRVHDVEAMRRVARVADAIVRGTDVPAESA
jgi:dihydropteroate synthase